MASSRVGSFNDGVFVRGRYARLQARACSGYYRGLDNYLYYFGGVPYYNDSIMGPNY